MNFEQARHNMIEQQLRPWNVCDAGVLEALRLVRREEFVPAALRALAFADTELALGGGATMFAPKIEARALQALAMGTHEKVLEVGTGSGYMAALLGVHADHVWSVEIDPQLAAAARESLHRAGVTNVSVETGDGLAGLPEHAPYDVIMVSGAVPAVPHALLDLLKPGGRLFAIEGRDHAMAATIYRRAGDGFARQALFETEVRPLCGTFAPPAFAL